MKPGDDGAWQRYSAHGGALRPHAFDPAAAKSRQRHTRRVASRLKLRWLVQAWIFAAAFAAPILIALYLSRGTVSDEEIRPDPMRPGPSLPMHKVTKR